MNLRRRIMTIAVIAAVCVLGVASVAFGNQPPEIPPLSF